jgi:hypothetical protein
MAYSIFLKYLRSLEEFRKNLHIKIPPKSPCAHFQRLGIFKNSIFIPQGIFLIFRHIRPNPTCVGVFVGRDAFFLSRHCHVGPAYQLHPLPHASRPLQLLLIASGHPTPPGLQPRDAKRGLHSPPSMALRPLPPDVSPSLASACPYKRARSTSWPSPHSSRPHFLAPESATSTPPSASFAGCSPPSPGRVRPSAAPSCSQ